MKLEKIEGQKYFMRSDGLQKTFKLNADKMDIFSVPFFNIYIEDVLEWRVLPDIPSVEICSSLALTRCADTKKAILQEYFMGIPSFSVAGKRYSVKHQFNTVFETCYDQEELELQEYPLRNNRKDSYYWVYDSVAKKLFRFESAKLISGFKDVYGRLRDQDKVIHKGKQLFKEASKSSFDSHYGDADYFITRLPEELNHLKL